MGASNVSIAYLADVTDLRTKSALAKSILSDTSSAIREQAGAFAELSDEARGPALAALQSLTAEQRELQAIVAKTAAELKKSTAATEEQSGALAALHERVKLTGEGFEHLSATVGVWTNAASAIGEFALAALGTERALESVNKWTEAVETLDKLSAATGVTIDQWVALQHVALMTATPFDIVKEDITKLTRAMEEAGESADSKAGRGFEAMGIKVKDANGNLRPTAEILDLVAAKMASYAAGTNKAALELALFGRSGTDLNAVLTELGRDGLASTIDQVKTLGLTLDPEAVENAKKYQESIKHLTEEWQVFTNKIMQVVVPALDKVMSVMVDAPIEQRIADIKTQLASIGKDESFGDLNKSLSAALDDPLSLIWDASQADGRSIGALRTELAALEAQKAQMDKDSAARGAQPKPGSVQAPASTDKGTKPETDIDKWKDQLLQMQAADGKFHAMSAAQEAAFWQSKIALTKQGTAAQREVLQEFESASRRAQTEGARAGTKAVRDEWELYSATIKEKIAADDGHLDKQIALATQWVAKAASLYKIDSKQYEEALKEKNALDREQSEKTLSIAKDMAEAQASLDKIATAGKDRDEFKPNIGLAFDSSGLDAKVAAQVQQLRAALDEQLALLAKDMKGKIDLGDTVAAATDYKEATAALETFATKAAQVNEQAANAVAQSWSKVATPIESAFGSIVGAAIGGGQKSGVAMERAAVGIVQQWAKSGVDLLAHWAATQIGMTATAAAGSAARVVAASPEEAATIAQLAAMLGKHVAVETAKTGATITGVTVRTAAESAGAATSKAAEAAAGSSTVMSAAAKAAAGAYSSVAQIPYVGWLLAPAAAAVAFTAVAAYETVASAEGGEGSVPYDNAPYLLHKQEMVLPAPIAKSVREMASAGRGAPGLATAGAASSTTNIGGNTYHHSTSIDATIHSGAQAQDVHSVLRDASRSANRDATDYYGNTGARSLPGRRVHK